MKQVILLALLLLTAGGCMTPTDYAQQQADSEALREDVQRLKERLDGIQLEQQNLARDIEKTRALSRDDTQQQQTRARLDAVERQLQALNAAREQDRKAVVDELSRKMATIISSQAPAPSSSRSGGSSRASGSDTGYEHVVQQGETLSAIASAYKVSSSAILRANNLQSPNLLRVGQKLFIPR